MFKADHKIDIGPEIMCDRHRNRQWIIAWNNTVAGTESNSGRADPFGKLPHGLRIVLRAAADNDHRCFCAGDKLCRLGNGTAVGL